MRAKGGTIRTTAPTPEGLHPAVLRVAIANQTATGRRARIRVKRSAVPLLRAVASAMAHLETERLVIRASTPADAPGLAQTIDSLVMAANGYTPQHVADVLTQTSRPRAGIGSKYSVRAVIVARTTGEVVGSIAYMWVDPTHRSCELGWWIGPAARGRGYASEAVAAVVPALHAAGVRRVWMGTAPDNIAVRRTIARIGAVFVDQGLMPLPDGRPTPSLWFAHDR